MIAPVAIVLATLSHAQDTGPTTESLHLIYDTINGLREYDGATKAVRELRASGTAGWPPGETGVARFYGRKLLVHHKRADGEYRLFELDRDLGQVSDLGPGRRGAYLPSLDVLVYYDSDRSRAAPERTPSGATVSHVLARPRLQSAEGARVIARGPWPERPLIPVPPDRLVIPGEFKERSSYLYSFADESLRELPLGERTTPEAWRAGTSELIVFNHETRRVQYVDLATGKARDADHLDAREIPNLYVPELDALIVTGASMNRSGDAVGESYETWLVRLSSGRRERLNVAIHSGYVVATLEE
jgi:hypothetical protein